MKRNIISKVSTGLILLIIANISFAGTCVGKFINPVTDLCWSCLFPLTLGEASLHSSKVPDTKNPKSAVCACPSISGAPKVGLSVGFWEPTKLIEVVRQPYCFPSLGGLQMGTKNIQKHGAVSNSHNSFYQVHAYKYPVLAMLDILVGGNCLSDQKFDIAWLSELDPTWQDDALTAIVNPESILFGNFIAQATCSADCISANTKFRTDKLFWCAGCQGSIYPLNGRVQSHVSGVQASLLLLQRLMFKLHRLGFEIATDSQSLKQLCYMPKRFVMHPSVYRTQMVYPVVARKARLGGCEPLGRTSVFWEQFKNFPIKGEDYSYVLWKKRNCCAF